MESNLFLRLLKKVPLIFDDASIVIFKELNEEAMHIGCFDSFFFIFTSRFKIFINSVLVVIGFIPYKFGYTIFIHQIIVFTFLLFSCLIYLFFVVWFFQIVLLDRVEILHHIFEKLLVFFKYLLFLHFLQLSFIGVYLKTLPDEDFINFDLFVQLKNKLQGFHYSFFLICL